MADQETHRHDEDCETCPDKGTEPIARPAGGVSRRRFLGGTIAGAVAFAMARFLPPLGIPGFGSVSVAEAACYECDCWVWIGGGCGCDYDNCVPACCPGSKDDTRNAYHVYFKVEESSPPYNCVCDYFCYSIVEWECCGCTPV